MEAVMRENKIPLYTLETKSPLSDFDVVGFTLQYEMSCTNVLNMLDMAGIPVKSKDRTESDPIICAGGPCAYNPEPMAEFIDFFVIGEGEEVIGEILDEVKVWKEAGGTRQALLKKLAQIEGVYVPIFYDVTYNEDGTIKEFAANTSDVPATVKKRFVKDLDKTYFPEKIIVPFIKIVHDRIMLEIFRGCTRGCRFCQAGFIYRPIRERSASNLLDIAIESVKNTGYEEISLTSLSTGDYSQLDEFATELVGAMESKRVNFSLPSMRIDTFPRALMEKAQKVRKSGLTFAPEAGTQRLRDVVNKGVTENDLEKSVSFAFDGGWSTVKFYFMLGLPGETDEDIAGISYLAYKIIRIYKTGEARAKGLQINLSTSSFVPKPFTPFQWEAQEEMEELDRKQMMLKDRLKSGIIKYSYSDNKTSFLEAVLARGDRRVGEVIYEAWKDGAKFDGWGEHFKFEKWMTAFEKTNVDPKFYANRHREYDEILPWDFIDCGVTKEYLIKESKKASEGITTTDCRNQCGACGLESFCSTREQKEIIAPTEMKVSPVEITLPENLQTMRVEFSKGEEVKYISHLDMMSTFERALKRAEIPIHFSEGYNPRPHLVFGMPIPLGYTTTKDYVDILLDKADENIVEKLNANLPDGIRVSAASVLDTNDSIMAQVKAAEYSVTFTQKPEGFDELLIKAVDKFNDSEEVFITKEKKPKKTKRGKRYREPERVDIRPSVFTLKIEDGKLTMFVKAGSEGNIRPDLLLKALELPETDFLINRDNLLRIVDGKFVPLI
jgi:radical SAM family uncharacterized protein/radical SAM-linked protein